MTMDDPGFTKINIIYLLFSTKTEDSQLRNELINDVRVELSELMTLKIYFAILRYNIMFTLSTIPHTM